MAGNGNKMNIALLKKDIDYIKTEVQSINYKLDNIYITKIEFEPIKKLVYGLIGVILSGLVGGAILLLFNS
jgi:hypothetical protein